MNLRNEKHQYLLLTVVKFIPILYVICQVPLGVTMVILQIQVN
jgi:hypothetical protein